MFAVIYQGNAVVVGVDVYCSTCHEMPEARHERLFESFSSHE